MNLTEIREIGEDGVEVYIVNYSGGYVSRLGPNTGICHAYKKPAYFMHGREYWFTIGRQHRIAAPAYIDYNMNTEGWWYDGKNITNGVQKWIRDERLPHWSEWDIELQSLFVLKFS